MRERRISMTQFGRWGRAGNQFFQYAFLTGYAFKHDLRLEMPPWVGNQLFGTDDPPIDEGKPLPVYQERRMKNHQPATPVGNEVVGHDFRGYAQYHTSYYSDDRNRIHNLFQPCNEVRDRLEHPAKLLREGCDAVIGIHLRRGDYGRSYFPIIPVDWYLKWLQTHIDRFGRYRLFISTEDTTLVDAFSYHHTITSQELGVQLSQEPMEGYNYLNYDLNVREPHQMDWYPDFYLLSQCDVIVGPNSTFSFFAAILNSNLREYWRARLSLGAFEQIDPWDSWPLLREFVHHYPHLDGIALKDNPYWRSDAKAGRDTTWQT